MIRTHPHEFSENVIACIKLPYTQYLITKNDQVNFQWDDDEVRFVLDQHAELDFYIASSLKQQSADRHVAPLGHIILIPSQPAALIQVKMSSNLICENYFLPFHADLF
jgi:hypothetical protein